MNNYPSPTSGEFACDINLPDLPPTRRKEVQKTPIERWLQQPLVEGPWSEFALNGKQVWKEAAEKSIDSYGLVEYPPKAYIGELGPFAATKPFFSYVGSIGEGQKGAAAGASRTRAASGSSELPRQGVSRDGSVPLKSTRQAKMKYTPPLSYA